MDDAFFVSRSHAIPDLNRKVQQFADRKVQNLGFAPIGDEDVRWLDVLFAHGQRVLSHGSSGKRAKMMKLMAAGFHQYLFHLANLHQHLRKSRYLIRTNNSDTSDVRSTATLSRLAAARTKSRRRPPQGCRNIQSGHRCHCSEGEAGVRVEGEGQEGSEKWPRPLL